MLSRQIYNRGIKVRREDQGVHTFLWEIDDKIRVMRFRKYQFWNKNSPFMSSATINHHMALTLSE